MMLDALTCTILCAVRCGYRVSGPVRYDGRRMGVTGTVARDHDLVCSLTLVSTLDETPELDTLHNIGMAHPPWGPGTDVGRGGISPPLTKGTRRDDPALYMRRGGQSTRLGLGTSVPAANAVGVAEEVVGW